tara:strand:+ start:585 stop:764 length:180 start_codon:yes stop_codon:yes gene_type:complete
MRGRAKYERVRELSVRERAKSSVRQRARCERELSIQAWERARHERELSMGKRAKHEREG